MKLINYILVILVLSFVIIEPIAASESSLANLETFIDGAILAQMEKSGASAATISIVQDGRLVLNKGYGHANIDSGLPVLPESTMFRVGSISKLFTWTAIMQLVEQGKLDLDADVNTYLDFEIPSARLGINLPPITLRHLLTHTPGFEDISDGLFFLSAKKMVSLGEYVRTYLPTRVYAPGEALAYSNYGTTLAGYVVERVSGMPYTEYVEKYIFAPLSMSNSTFRQPLTASQAKNMVTGYNQINGEHLEGSFIYVQPAPAGSLSTTSADMARFIMAHLQGGALDGNRILLETSVKIMHSQGFTHHSSLDGMTLGFIEATINGEHVLYHGGSLPLSSSGIYLIPGRDVGLFVSFSGGVDFLAPGELFQNFMDKYYPGVVPQITPPTGSRERSKRFAGEYHINRRSFTTDESLLSLLQSMQITVDKEGYLLATFMGETNRFVEIEPGLYQNLRQGRSPVPYGEFRTIAFVEGMGGRIMLASDGPMTYTKAPWYATLPFTVLSIGVAILVMFGSLLYWLVTALILVLRKKKGHINLESAARYTAIALALCVLVIVVGIAGSADMSPTYGVPLSYFGIVPEWVSVVSTFQATLLPLTLGVAIFTLVAWCKRFWTTTARVHYSTFALSSVLLLWILKYWNLA